MSYPDFNLELQPFFRIDYQIFPHESPAFISSQTCHTNVHSASFSILYTFHINSLSSQSLLPTFSLLHLRASLSTQPPTWNRVTSFLNCLTHPPCLIKYKESPVDFTSQISPEFIHFPLPLQLIAQATPLLLRQHLSGLFASLLLPYMMTIETFYPAKSHSLLTALKVTLKLLNMADRALQVVVLAFQSHPLSLSPLVLQSVTVNMSHSHHMPQDQSFFTCLCLHLPAHQSSLECLLPSILSAQSRCLIKIYWIKYYGSYIFNKFNLQKQGSNNKRFCSSITLCSTAFSSAFCISALSCFSMLEEELLAEAIVISR